MSRETTQDTLSPEESIVDELDDGTRLLAVEVEGGGEEYRVETARGEVREFVRDTTAKTFFRLYDLAGGFSTPDSPDVVPVDVAILGKASIAAFLVSAFDLTAADVADRLDVAEASIWTYSYKIREGNPGRPD